MSLIDSWASFQEGEGCSCGLRTVWKLTEGGQELCVVVVLGEVCHTWLREVQLTQPSLDKVIHFWSKNGH